MLGRKSYTREELNHARSAFEIQLAAYEKLVGACEATTGARPGRQSPNSTGCSSAS